MIECIKVMIMIFRSQYHSLRAYTYWQIFVIWMIIPVKNNSNAKIYSTCVSKLESRMLITITNSNSSCSLEVNSSEVLLKSQFSRYRVKGPIIYKTNCNHYKDHSSYEISLVWWNYRSRTCARLPYNPTVKSFQFISRDIYLNNRDNYSDSTSQLLCKIMNTETMIHLFAFDILFTCNS